MIQVNTILLIRGSHFGKTLGLFFEGDSVLMMGNTLHWFYTFTNVLICVLLHCTKLHHFFFVKVMVMVFKDPLPYHHHSYHLHHHCYLAAIADGCVMRVLFSNTSLYITLIFIIHT